MLGFPCNQFGAQEPGSNASIKQFAKSAYGVTFPLMAKVDVNGPGGELELAGTTGLLLQQIHVFIII